MPGVLTWVLALVALLILLVAHVAFWSWIYRVRPQQDELRYAKTKDGWEIALAHAKSRTGALTVLRRAHKLAGSRAKLERDGCTDYEPAIVGLKSKRAAEALLRRAKAIGFASASIERS